MGQNRSRDPGLDILRCIALLGMAVGHFCHHTGFFNETMTGGWMLLGAALRSAAKVTVPVFLMLTGYLVTTKNTGVKYYIRIVRVLFIYVLSSILCSLFKVFVLKESLSVLGALRKMVEFDGTTYEWYIEMYIGLFLLTPLLNILYDGLTTQKQKKILVFTLLFLTTMPRMLNVYCLDDPGWWLRPSSSKNYASLVPDMWGSLYPIAHFYLGRYLREYPIKLESWKLFVLSLAAFAFGGLYNFYRSYGSTFVFGPWQENGSALYTLQAVLRFAFFTSLNYERMSERVRRFFAWGSDLTLGAYLVSWIFDMIVYGKLNSYGMSMDRKMLWLPVTVLTVLVCSFVLSQVIDWLYRLTAKKWVARVSAAAGKDQ